MSTQTWFSSWEDEEVNRSVDLTKIIEKERNNKQAPQTYQHFFEKIYTYLQMSGKGKSMGDLDDHSLDYRYKDHVLTLQDNYEALEEVYKKQYTENVHMQQSLSDTHIKLNQQKQHFDEQLAEKTQALDNANRTLRESVETNLILREKTNKVIQQYKLLETTAKTDQKALTDQINSLRNNLLHANEQVNLKDRQLHMNARQRRQLEVQMMDTHKDLINAQSQLAQEKTKVAQLTKYIQESITTVLTRANSGQQQQQQQPPQQQQRPHQWQNNPSGQPRPILPVHSSSTSTTSPAGSTAINIPHSSNPSNTTTPPH